MDNLLELFGIAYLVMAFIKVMLCVPQMPLAVFTLSRLSGAPKGKALLRYALMVPPLVVVVALFGWMVSFRKEGIRFFLVYSNYAVMHDCVGAYREAHA